MCRQREHSKSSHIWTLTESLGRRRKYFVDIATLVLGLKLLERFVYSMSLPAGRWWLLGWWWEKTVTANVHFPGNGKMYVWFARGIVWFGLGTVSCYMHGGFDTSRFASIVPTLVLFQLCVDRFKSLRSLTELKFSKTLLEVCRASETSKL